VPADAVWCTLCFATLRPQAAAPVPSEPTPSEPAPSAPEPFAMPLTAAVTAPVLSAPVHPVPVHSAPVLSAPVPTQPVPAAPAPAGPVATAVAEQVEDAAVTWPCTACGERVPLDAMVCPRCGGAFMGGVNPNVSLNLPGIGDLGSMSTGAKFGVMAGGATLLTALFVLVLFILGHVF